MRGSTYLRNAGIGLLVFLMLGWGALAIYFSNLPQAGRRSALAIAYVIGGLAALMFFKNRRRTIIAMVAVFAGLVVWYFLIPPSNDRGWQTDVAVLPTAEVNGNRVTIRNIRNFDYDYQDHRVVVPHYYDKTFNFDQLQSVDLLCSHWGGDTYAHVMLSFGFGTNDFVTISIEARKEVGEAYSPFRGLFRQYELIYVVADERDVIRCRTNYRQPPEQVYLYRTRMPRESQRALFLDYVKRINQLAEKPEWYHSLAGNCMTGVAHHTRAFRTHVGYSYKILLSVYAAQYAYEIKALDTRLSFEELRKRGHINELASAGEPTEDFSRRIRQGMPVPSMEGETTVEP